jgi:hypothetical protein
MEDLKKQNGASELADAQLSAGELEAVAGGAPQAEPSLYEAGHNGKHISVVIIE